MSQTDPTKRAALNSLLRYHEDRAISPLAVSVEQFFEGNHDYGSIGCNLPEHPGPQRFYAVLREIRSKHNVQDVMVELHGFEDESSWPFSEQVHVITTADPETVKDWVEELQPDEVHLPSSSELPAGLPDPKAGYRSVRLWWD